MRLNMIYNAFMILVCPFVHHQFSLCGKEQNPTKLVVCSMEEALKCWKSYF